MTLLNSKLNTSISNGTFHDKLNGKSGKKGIKDLADLMLTKEVIKNTEWDERKIAARNGELEKQIRDIRDVQTLPAEVAVKLPKTGPRRKEFRMAFWEKAIRVIQEKNNQECFTNVHPTTNNAVSGSFGISGFSIVCVANYDRLVNDANADLYISFDNEIKKKLGL